MDFKFLFFAILIVFISCGDDDIGDLIIEPTVENDLFIPPLIDSRVSGTSITLTMQEGETEFFDGVPSNTIGYNGSFLGPTIKTYEGDDITLTTVNNTGEPSTIHKHGLHVPGNVDGGPHQRIEAGGQRVDEIEIRQEASTNWYHPHLMGTNAEQVHSGLAGMWLVEDDNSESLNLPNEYGVNDIPLIVMDRFFVNNVMTYEDGLDDMEFLGNTIIANGTVGAFKEVPTGWIRFRILNGSNARFYDFEFEDNRQFFVIATEGGFLETPIAVNNFQAWPGERYEIMVDFSNSANVNLTATDPENGGGIFNIIELRPNENISADGSLPQALNSIVRYNPNDVVNTREFELQVNGVQGGMMGINGFAMNMDIINERINRGELERWVIDAQGEHPFHMHGASFLIESLDGGAVPAYENGWKDVVKINEEAVILIKFDYLADEDAPYMYHCHILEHEDMGMMGQFTVE